MTKIDLYDHDEFDLLILGGGISGATLFRVASDSGKKVLLLDQKDFASGTSQSSGMLIWGGLLYLKNLELRLVRKLCKARDYLINNSDEVYLRRIHFSFLKKKGRSNNLVKYGLRLYRLLSYYKRSPAFKFSNKSLPEAWDESKFKGGLAFEEGFLKNSDAHFTLQWLFRANDRKDCNALNYCDVNSISWNLQNQLFEVDFIDYNKIKHRVCTKNIVNACGIWADKVNEHFSIKTKAHHHLSKGVYLILDNKNKESDAFVIDMQEKNDVLCWVPWGDTVMWGPTETSIDSLEELPVNAEDVSFLLRKLNVNTKATFTKKDILNVRTGIRPLVKKNDKKVEYSLDMSRKALIEKDSKLPWFTIFGGKISGSLGFSLKVFKKVFASAPKLNEIDYSLQVPMSTEYFDGLSLPSVEWCVTNTQVRCLEDYLRRRTNVAQWIPMGGLGFDQGYKSDLKKLAFLIHVNPEDAESDFKDYIQRQIKERQTWEN